MADEALRAGPEQGKGIKSPVARGPLWGALLRGGLGARLVLAQVLVATAMLAVAALGVSRVRVVGVRLQRVYDHRVLPLQRLQEVSDLFAIDFVDDVHKAADASIGWREGSDVLDRVRGQTNAKWQTAETLMTTEQERAVLTRIRPVFRQALDCLSEAGQLMHEGSADQLRHWRATQLYRRVDPLTLQLHALIAEELSTARADLAALREDLAHSARESTIGLGLAGLFAIAVGLNIAKRFLSSLGRIGDVVHTASEGDLSARVQLAGNDELAVMAARIDQMIESIQASQAALARSEAETRAASATKSIFLGNVSHELRTPLNVILGYAQVLKRDGRGPPEHQSGIARILEAGNHLLRLIDDILGIARLEASKLTVHVQPCSPKGLIEEAERMLRPRAEAKGLLWVTQIEGRLPDAVDTDRRRLLQVLLNLGGNAIKFSSVGTVTLRASWHTNRLAFEVLDTGPGIGHEEQIRLFEAFSQGTAGLNSGEGTGLGLYISQAICRLLGGEIALESEAGKGSRFSFWVNAPAGGQPAQSPERAVRRLASGVQLAPMLIVDDRDTNREVLRALLEGAGFTVEEASDGQAALERILRGPLSLVWMDLKMPVLDGFQAILQQRAREASTGARRLPVVAITASVATLTVEQARELGFDDLLAKPFDAEAVLDAVERLAGVQLEQEQPKQPETEPQPFDLAQLSAEVRRALLKLLVLGDTQAAVALLDQSSFAGEAEGLRREILSFRSERVIARLRSLASN